MGKDGWLREGEDSYISHVIIPSKNYRASKKFYEEVFGWKVTKRKGTDSLDALPQSGRGINAQLSSQEEVVVPAIHTSNIEVKLGLIERYGGRRLIGKTPIGKHGEGGFFALFRDAQGSKLYLYSED